MEKDLVSIVVPVYKVEKYIRECIDSILNQTYKNLEVILVDDGSLDNCPYICDQYALKDKRITVYHKKNGGLSDARNYGLKMANGRYVMFIDSDDYIENDMVETLLKNIINYKADISICDCYFLYKDKIIKNDVENNIQEMSHDEALLRLNKQNSFGFAAWNKMYKKELFSTISFPKGKVNEDWYIMYKIFDKAKKVIYQPIAKYYYRQRKSSISKDSSINYNPILASTRCTKYMQRKYPNLVENAYGNEIFADITVYNRLINIKGEKIKKKYIKRKIKENKNKMERFRLYFENKKVVQIYLLIYFPIIYKILYNLKKDDNKKYFD